jgi:MFS family permease
VFLYVAMAWTEAYAVVTVSALLRDFSPRTSRAVGVGLVTVGTLAANWGTAFMAGHLLAGAGTWQHMFLDFAEREGIKIDGFWDYVRKDWRLWALAAAQGTFLLGYITFVAYGPLFTIEAFHKSPQEGSSLSSWVFLSIIVFLVLGGILSDRLRLRKALGFGFTILSGAALITLGLLSGASLSTAEIIILYVVTGALMACMWSPTNALFSETAEDIHVSRQTTAFGGQGVVSRPIYQAWIFLIPVVLGHLGWEWVWIISGVGALVSAPILVICRGSWGRFTLPQVEVLAPAEVTVGSVAPEGGGQGQ